MACCTSVSYLFVADRQLYFCLQARKTPSSLLTLYSRIEQHLRLIGFDVLSIRSSHSHVERAEVVKLFTDPKSKYQCLVISFKLGIFGLNFHNACFTVVFTDMIKDLNSFLQGIGRVHRVGQLVAQTIYVLLMRNSYDITLTEKAYRKFIPQVAAEGNFQDIPEDELEDKVRELLGKLLGYWMEQQKKIDGAAPKLSTFHMNVEKGVRRSAKKAAKEEREARFTQHLTPSKKGKSPHSTLKLTLIMPQHPFPPNELPDPMMSRLTMALMRHQLAFASRGAQPRQLVSFLPPGNKDMLTNSRADQGESSSAANEKVPYGLGAYEQWKDPKDGQIYYVKSEPVGPEPPAPAVKKSAPKRRVTPASPTALRASKRLKKG